MCSGIVILLIGAPTAVAAGAETLGRWETLAARMPINPIHAMLLQSGRILIVAGSENDPTEKRRRAAVWDRISGIIGVRDIPWDSFCSGISATADGRRLITGGTAAYPGAGSEFLGFRNTAIYDPNAAGSFVVYGSGTGIGGSRDGFHFQYVTLTGDGEIRARISGLPESPKPGEPKPNPWATAGVMIRETLSPDARDAFIGLTYGYGFGFQQRRGTDASGSSVSEYASVGAAMSENWVRLVRKGDTFFGFTSADGASWVRVGAAQIPMSSSTVYMGLAVSAHATSPYDRAVNASTFNRIRLVRTTRDAWRRSDVGAVGVGGGGFPAGDFASGPDMSAGRWYPTNTALADGTTLTISGYREDGEMNRVLGVLDVGSMAWTDSTPVARGILNLYPWGHLLPDTAGPLAGKVFFSGPSVDTAVVDVNPASDIYLKYVSLAKRVNTLVGRAYGSSVLLPLRPETNFRPEVLVMGGHTPALRTAERIDLSEAVPVWQPAAPMAFARVQMNATLLPDGKVLATGGSAIDEIRSTAVRTAEVYDPESDSWTTQATANAARMYHSVALLLPDATVWTAGSNPVQGSYETTMEVFKPPYLFTTDAQGVTVPATRPVISAVPRTIGYASPFTISTPSGPGIRSVVLMRLGASTHAFDMEQRLIGLRFETGSQFVTAQGPANASYAPPGYYMLFVLDQKGVPSLAAFVQLVA